MGWKDIDIDLERQHDGDFKADIDVDAVINSVTNIFKTFQGSRRMVPSFAMPVYNLLFEQIDDISMSSLKSMLLSAIDLWEDRIYIDYLDAVADHDRNRIDLRLQMRLRNDPTDRVFNINETLVMQK